MVSDLSAFNLSQQTTYLWPVGKNTSAFTEAMGYVHANFNLLFFFRQSKIPISNEVKVQE